MLLTRPHGPVLTYLRGLRSNRVALNSAYMMGSQFSIALLQAVQFLLLARALGSHEFGIVASVVAITSALLPFSGLGLGNVAIMHIARGQAGADRSLGNGLAVTTVTAVVGVGLALLIGKFFLDEPGIWLLVLLFSVSEILLTKYIDIAAHVFLAREEHGVAACFLNLQMLVRVVCAAALWWGWTQPTALAWAQLHLGAGVLTTGLVLYVSVRMLGRPRTDYTSVKSDIQKGVFFSIGISARNVQTDVDKIVVARMESAGTAGAYTAAFRLAYMACTPVVAILLALRARLFRKGHHGGIAGTLGALRGLIPIAGAYCMLLAVGIYLAAPAVPWLLGPTYQLSSEILQWLCFLPFLLSGQSVCSEALSGANAQRRLSFLHALTAALALLLNLILVPLYGWRGAVMAAYGAQGFLVVGLLLTIMLMRRAEREASR
jgi:O-antigen/teichoic acid export membrane protein